MVQPIGATRRRSLKLLLLSIAVVLAAYGFIRHRWGPLNPELFFTSKRQAAFSQMSAQLAECSAYTNLEIACSALGNISVETDGSLPTGWESMIQEFMRKNRMRRLRVDKDSGKVIWMHVFMRMPVFYQYNTSGGTTNLPVEARYVESLGSNWVYYVLSGS